MQRLMPISDNETIATAINPRGKGWAWTKHGPLNFDEPVHHVALTAWMQRQAWWHKPAIPPYDCGVAGATWSDVYFSLCTMAAENNEPQEQLHRNTVQVAVAAIRHDRRLSNP
jgi:hypothetical protein